MLGKRTRETSGRPGLDSTGASVHRPEREADRKGVSVQGGASSCEGEGRSTETSGDEPRMEGEQQETPPWAEV